MAKLPKGDKAIVPLDKLSGYSLNLAHPTGKHKARVFRAVLGLGVEDAVFLQEKIQEIATTHDAIPQSPTVFGDRYVVDFELQTAIGTATVRTAWIVRNNESVPRLTSCYVIRKE